MANLSATINRRFLLKNLPSASGIEIIGNAIYVVCDNSSYLYVLDFNFEIKRRIPLLNESPSDLIASKKSKMDLESLTLIRSRGIDSLLILGSGSVKGKRERAFLADLRTDLTIEELQLKDFYSHLHRLVKKEGAGILNIEATAFEAGIVHLFHRGNISGKNLMFSIHWKELLENDKENYPNMMLQNFTLPAIGRTQAGFSGANVLGETGKIIFTASVEKTKSAVVDGPSLGSFTGIIESAGKTPTKLSITRVKEKTGDYKGKLESIAIKKLISKNECLALCVSDSDDESSEIVELTIKWK